MRASGQSRRTCNRSRRAAPCSLSRTASRPCAAQTASLPSTGGAWSRTGPTMSSFAQAGGMPRCIACRPESMKSDSAVIPLPGTATAGSSRRRHELEFLPAALEIVETPPSPVGRATAATLVGLFCIALAWAYLGYVDIVATAPGKIVPSGRTKVVQPLEIGVVRAIHVHDGQTVKAGDVL